MDESNNVFFDANVIYEAGNRAIKGSKFKRNTQFFEMNHLLFTAKIQKALMEGKYAPEAGVKFVINERGKKRYITSNAMADKVVNHIIADFVLTPLIGKYLIYDNGASQKGKGVRFHRERFETHLRQYYRHHGTNEGYILLVDFSGYYANIRHDVCQRVLAFFLEKGLRSQKPKKDVEPHSEEGLRTPEEVAFAKKLITQIFKTFEIDVSRFSDAEIERMKDSKVDQLLNCGVDPALLTGEKFLKKGVDIGNQISQNIGLIFAYAIDNYAKIVKHIKYYGRYTDDFYAISDSREELKELLEGFKDIADGFGLIINERKTRIVKLSSFYRHLQNGYSLTETGRVICKINPKSVTRERRKLKAYKRLLDKGVMPYEDVENSFKGWMGSNYKRMSLRQIYNLNDLYIRLFGRRPKWKKGSGRLRYLTAQSLKTSFSMGTTSSRRRRFGKAISPDDFPA